MEQEGIAIPRCPFVLYSRFVGIESRPMKPRFYAFSLLALLGAFPVAVRVPVRADARSPLSLTALVARNSLTRDTNDDGLADAVAARIIVPAAASLPDLEAATNLAARLGYETTALSLPLVVRDDNVPQPPSIAVPILVGRENRFTKPLIAAHTVDVSGLKAGQGLIAAVRSPLGGPDGLVVIGGDDEGTLNAGVELAARLPRVWGMTGASLPAVEDQALRYLRSRGVTPGGASVVSVLVDSDRRGLARVDLRLDVSNSRAARGCWRSWMRPTGAVSRPGRWTSRTSR